MIRHLSIVLALLLLNVVPVAAITNVQVNENSPQTLTNKTLTAPAVTNPTITGTVAGSPTITSPSITGTVGGSGTYTTPTLSGATLGATKALDTNWVSAERFVDLQQAVTQLGTTPTTLLITSSKPITANITFPSTLTMQFVAPGKLTCTTAGVTITINGSISAGFEKIFDLSGGCAVALAAGSTAVPHWWGVFLDGTTNDGGAIQAALTAGTGIALPCGTYAVATMLTMTDVSSKRVTGLGSSGAAGGCVTLKWTGAAGGTLLKLTGVRDSIFENFRITVGAAPSTLATAIDSDPTGRSQAETNNAFRYVSVIQRSGATTADGSLATGIRLSRSTSPGNVSEFKFDNLTIAGATSACVSIEHSQSYGHTFTSPQLSFCARGITTALNSSTGGGFQAYSVNLGNNTVADIDVSNGGTNNVAVYGGISQNSARVLLATGSSPFPITISGLAVAGSQNLNADGQVIQIGKASAGPKGPVRLTGNMFYGAETPGVGGAIAASIGFNQAVGGVVISEGNTFNNTAPFVNNGGVTELYTHGDQGWTGAAFVNLPSLPGSVGRDVTQTNVVSTVTQTTVHTTTIPPGFLGTNRTLRITIQGDFLNNTGGPLNNPAILLSYGAGIIVTLPSSTSFAASANRYSWTISLCMSNTSTGGQVATGRVTFMPFADDGTLPAATLDVPFMTNLVGYALGGVDSTVSKDFTVKITNAANNANYSTRKNSVQIESF